MRVTTALSRLLRLEGVWIRKVQFEPDRVVVDVALRRRRLSSARSASTRPGRGRTRGRRTRSGGIWTSGRGGSRSTAGDGGCGALSTGRARRASRSPGRGRSSPATSSASSRGWRPAPTRGRSSGWCGSTGTRSGGSSSACALMSSIPAGSRDCSTSGSTRSVGRQHRYLTLVVDHQRRAWCGAPKGAGEKAADRVLRRARPRAARTPPQPKRDEPPRSRQNRRGPSATARPEAGTQRVGPRAGRQARRRSRWTWAPGTPKSAREHAPQAIVCIDPYHVVQLANKALDEVRRDYWNELRRSGDQQAAKRFKDARW